MSRRRYIAWSGSTSNTNGLSSSTDFSIPTAPTSVAAGASIQQIFPTTNISIVEWGYQLTVVPTSIMYVELFTTTVAATMATAYVSGDIIPYDDANAPAAGLTLGTTTSGYGVATSDGTWASTRLLDQGPGWSQFYCKQFPLDREPGVTASTYLRIRAFGGGGTVGIRSYIVWES
jgi:hypothetical protein